MKRWFVEHSYIRNASEGTRRLQEKLNDMEQRGWTVEGIEPVGNERRIILIIAWREEEFYEEGDLPDLT